MNESANRKEEVQMALKVMNAVLSGPSSDKKTKHEIKKSKKKREAKLAEKNRAKMQSQVEKVEKNSGSLRSVTINQSESSDAKAIVNVVDEVFRPS